MDAQELALALIAILIILAIAVFAWRTRKQQGSTPTFDHEVFLWFDPTNPSPDPSAAASAATGLKSAVASPGQVALYAADGGSAAGAGLTSTGDIYWAPGPIYGSAAFEKLGTTSSFPDGVWLIGPKPAEGAQGVLPFSCRTWYQVSAHSGGAAASVPEHATTIAASRLATAQRRFARRMAAVRR